MGSVDWADEWLSSLIWIAVASVATVVVVAVLGLLLARFTTWGGQVRRLVGPGCTQG